MQDRFDVEKHGETIRLIVSHNQRNISKALKNNDYKDLWLVDENFKPTQPKGTVFFRRMDDITAATYAGYAAINQKSGEDSVNHKGHFLECKLASFSTDKLNIGVNGGLKYGKGSLRSSLKAYFRVYEGTELVGKCLDTVLVLYCEDLGQYVGGFALPREKVITYLDSKKRDNSNVGRTISLNQFMAEGYEFTSPISNLRYLDFEKIAYEKTLAFERKVDKSLAIQYLNEWKKLKNG